jgi:hypothetical protein
MPVMAERAGVLAALVLSESDGQQDYDRHHLIGYYSKSSWASSGRRTCCIKAGATSLTVTKSRSYSCRI